MIVGAVSSHPGIQGRPNDAIAEAARDSFALSARPLVQSNTNRIATLLPAVRGRGGGSYAHNDGTLIAASANELVTGIEAGRISVALLDPAGLRREALSAIGSAVHRSGRLLILVGPPSVAAANAAAVLAEHTRFELVFDGADNGRTVIDQLIRRPTTTTASSVVICQFARAICSLSDALVVPLFALFGGHRIPKTVDDFVVGIRCHCRTVERSLHRVGLAGPRQLIAAARIAMIWDRTALGCGSPSALRNRYVDSPRTFSFGFRSMVGMSFRHAQRMLTGDEVASRLCSAMASEPRGVLGDLR